MQLQIMLARRNITLEQALFPGSLLPAEEVSTAEYTEYSCKLDWLLLLEEKGSFFLFFQVYSSFQLQC